MKYDYIIVGAGSAGGVLANRLSEDPTVTVCLMEAGTGDSSPTVSIPGAFAAHMLWHKYNWAYNSQEDASTFDRGHFCPRGKGLGGTSSINGMVYIRGHKSDYDNWAALGNDGWSYHDVLPYFKKSENNDRGSSTYHGADGLLPVSSIKKPTYKLSKVFVKAAQQAGHGYREDFNSNQLEGCGYYQFTIKNGVRAGVGASFITPALKRPNLTVITNAHASKIEFAGKRAVGMSYLSGGKTHRVDANREVIVSGGTMNSPQLLMLSGIGCPDELKQYNIPLVHALPGVGKNLQEHPDVSLVYESLLKDGFSLSLSGMKKISAHLVAYLTAKKGMFARSVTEAGGYFKSDESVEVPDIQIHFLPLMFDDHGRNIDYLMRHGFSSHVCLLRPKSRGFIKLKSADPTDAPLIKLNMLEHPDDMKAMISAVRKMREIIAAPAFNVYRGSELVPGEAHTSDEALEKQIRAHVAHVYHPVGTCKMGNDDLAVVDHELRVHGLEGLRVVDASIMPNLISGNTNAPSIMISERAADMIKAAHKGEHANSGREKEQGKIREPVAV